MIHSRQSFLMTQSRIALIVAILLSPVDAQNSEDRSSPETTIDPLPWTVEAVIGAPGASGWSLSDDGRKGLWVKREVDTAKDRFDSQLMLLDVKTGASRPLTVGKRDLRRPIFAESGMAILFLSSDPTPSGDSSESEEDKSQLWKIDLRGGDLRPITAEEMSIEDYELLDDGSIVYQAEGRKTARERMREDQKDETIVVEGLQEMLDSDSSIYRHWFKDQKTVRLVDSTNGPLDSFSVSPDGNYAVTSHSQSPSFEAEGKIPPRWFFHNLNTGSEKEIFSQTKTKPYSIHWSLDSKSCFLLWPHSSFDGEEMASVTQIKVLDTAGGEIEDFPLDWDRGLANSRVTFTDRGVILSLADGVKPRKAFYSKKSGALFDRQWIEGGDRGGIYSLTKAKDASACLISTGDASNPTRVHLATIEGSKLEIGREVWSEGFKKQKKAKTEVVRWIGALDEEVEGLVYYPHDYQEGESFPIIAMTHGGPHGADYDRFSESWAYAPNLYAERGAFILMTNYHGSSDYGLEFGESIRGKYYELELKDILSGIQMLVDEGKADPKQVGLIGWSNGAILSTGILTLAQHYAPGYDFTFLACAPGAGDVNWTSDYGNCAFGGTFDDYYLGGPPWSYLDTYLKKSPLFYAEEITTPTIIFFGTEDTAVPTSQGWEWYRALNSIGKAPVRFLLFPGEPHGLNKPSFQRRKLEEELAWFDRYFFKTKGDPDQEPPSAPKDSKLIEARMASQAQRQADSNLIGVTVDRHLIPETVPIETGKQVSRFEVTVGQWRSFDPNFEFGVPRELRAEPNHPATALDSAGVDAYLSWLEERTGDRWRLPTQKELEDLGEVAGESENTLDWWVGYAPAETDADHFRRMVVELGVSTALHVVGHHSPGKVKSAGTEYAIYDLTGNAAEPWRNSDGTTGIIPHCAVVSPDPYQRVIEPPPVEFIGLRLIREFGPKAQSKRAVF